MTVEPPWSDEVVFDERLTMGGRTAKEFDNVLTGTEEVAVTSALNAAIETRIEERDRRLRLTDHFWVTPGSDSAPAVENIQIRIRSTDDGPRVVVDTIEVFRESG